MKKEITITHNPEERPQVEISVSQGSNPKEDLLILCDAITCLIKILHANDVQKDETSMIQVSDRINAGYLDNDIRTESVTSEEEGVSPAPMPSHYKETNPIDHGVELVKDINAAIEKQNGKIQFAQIFGIIENIKFDMWFQHCKRMGML